MKESGDGAWVDMWLDWWLTIARIYFDRQLWMVCVHLVYYLFNA